MFLQISSAKLGGKTVGDFGPKVSLGCPLFAPTLTNNDLIDSNVELQV